MPLLVAGDVLEGDVAPGWGGDGADERKKLRLMVTGAKIGKGQFSEVYPSTVIAAGASAGDATGGGDVALKIEPEARTLRGELATLKSLQGCSAVCRYRGSGHYNGNMFIAMERLGSNLAELRRMHGAADGVGGGAAPNPRFGAKTVRLLGFYLLDALRQIHDAGYVHRDVKPANFAIRLPNAPLVGRAAADPGRRRQADGRGENRFCILDFGLCRRFLDDSGRIKPPRSRGKDGFRGSTSYASVSSHKGDELGRRDDLWSLFYVIVECLYGSLPWRGIRVEPGTKGNENEEEDSGDQLKKRIRMSKDESIEDPDLLTAGEGALPGWAVDLSEYIRSLRFEEAPDYERMIAILDPDFDHVPEWERPCGGGPAGGAAEEPRLKGVSEEGDGKDEVAKRRRSQRASLDRHLPPDRAGAPMHRQETGSDGKREERDGGGNRGRFSDAAANERRPGSRGHPSSHRGDRRSPSRSRSRSRSPPRRFEVRPIVRRDDLRGLSARGHGLIEVRIPLPHAVSHTQSPLVPIRVHGT